MTWRTDMQNAPRGKETVFREDVAAWKDTLGIIAFGQPSEEIKATPRKGATASRGQPVLKPGPHPHQARATSPYLNRPLRSLEDVRRTKQGE